MTPAPYIDKTEYQAVLDITNSIEKFKRIKVLADSGNVQAAWCFGSMLLTGGWDESRMGIDFLRGVLSPETTDPKLDPYMVVPRDQFAAFYYLKIAAGFPDENQAIEVSYSRAILNYCGKKANIGYPNKASKLDLHIKMILIQVAKRAQPKDIQDNPFIPYPYKRPEVKNPRTKIFSRVATSMLSRNITGFSIVFLALISIAFLLMLCELYEIENAHSVNMLFAPVVFVTVMFPLIISSLICYKYGILHMMPLCSCDAIKKSYQAELEKLPEDCCRSGDDPFAVSPLWTRNFHRLKHVTFVINIVVSLIFIGLILFNSLGQNNSLNYVFFIPSVCVLMLSLMVLMMDKQLCLVDRDCEWTQSTYEPLIFRK